LFKGDDHVKKKRAYLPETVDRTNAIPLCIKSLVLAVSGRNSSDLIHRGMASICDIIELLIQRLQKRLVAPLS
jgi:hypothetical protein